MRTDVTPYQLEAIKALTLIKAGIEKPSESDTQFIAAAIFKKTGLLVSNYTIKKVFGLVMSMFNPSFITLNTLARYCDYESWEAFCAIQPNRPQKDHHFKNELIEEQPLVTALMETSIPTLILKANAPDFAIVTYNKAFEHITYTKYRQITGLTLWEAFDPERAGGYGPTLMLEAFHEVVYKKQTLQMPALNYNIPSAAHNIMELNWWDVKIIPVVYNSVTEYLVLHIHNITDKILHEDAIERAIFQELTQAEDLAKTNVKLNLSLQNLAEGNEELTNTKKQLEEINKHLEQRVFDRTKKLFESDATQRKVIDNAPVAIGMLRGVDQFVEVANRKLVEYWGKEDSVINKPLVMALPELEGQPFIGILDEVRKSGISYVNPELRAFLDFNGVYQPRYFDMIYQPIQHTPGITDSIVIVAFDITDHVIARKKLEGSESMLRLAVTAGNIGTWSFNTHDKTITYNAMFAKILGWDSDEHMTFEQALSRVTDEFREKLAEIIDSIILNGGDYNFTYTQRRFNDNRVIWLQGTGKVMLDDSGENRVFSGITREISEKEANLV